MLWTQHHFLVYGNFGLSYTSPALYMASWRMQPRTGTATALPSMSPSCLLESPAAFQGISFLVNPMIFMSSFGVVLRPRVDIHGPPCPPLERVSVLAMFTPQTLYLSLQSTSMAGTLCATVVFSVREANQSSPVRRRGDRLERGTLRHAGRSPSRQRRVWWAPVDARMH